MGIWYIPVLFQVLRVSNTWELTLRQSLLGKSSCPLDTQKFRNRVRILAHHWTMDWHRPKQVSGTAILNFILTFWHI